MLELSYTQFENTLCWLSTANKHSGVALEPTSFWAAGRSYLITPQLLGRFTVLELVTGAGLSWKGQIPLSQKVIPLFLPSHSYAVFWATALKYLCVNKVLALMELFKVPRYSKVPCISYLWITVYSEHSQCWTLVNLDWGTWENIFLCRDTTGFWCICLKRHIWVDIHIHTNISPFLFLSHESEIPVPNPHVTGQAVEAESQN